MSLPNILVLGATGKVGAATIRHLRAAGDSVVVAAARTPEKAKALQDDGLNSVVLDLDKPETLEAALAGVDRALLLTGYSYHMLQQSKRFIDAAKQAGVHHIVHIGASGAPTTEVAHWGWHQFVEAYVEQKGFSFTHLRPEAFMQNVTAFGWLQGTTLNHYLAEARWSWVDCDDLALVAAQALREADKYNGQIIPMGYDAKTMHEVAAILTEATGVTVSAKDNDPKEFLRGAIAAGADAAYMGCVARQFELCRDGAIPDMDKVFDNFEAITGKKPTTWQDFVQRNKSDLLPGS